MKIVIKEKKGDKWQHVDVKRLHGSTMLDVMKATDTEIVAAIYQDDKAVLFVSNTVERVEQYKSKGVSLHVDDAIHIFQTILPEQIQVAFTAFGGELTEFKIVDAKTSAALKEKGATQQILFT